MTQTISWIGRFLRLLCSALLILLAVSPAPTLAQGVAPNSAPPIAAAADLQFALPEIVAAFARSGGAPLRLSFGSSGNFARQIVQGAPFELFLAADDRYVAQVITAQRADGPGTHYATGRLALFLPQASPIRADRNLADLSAAARDGRLKRLAIANPEHAPYGRAAREVLEQRGLWSAVQDKLALGDNAAQAAQFAASGAAQAGLIPLSLARAPELATRGAYVTLPENWHTPLRQTLVLVKGAGPTARAFAEFLRGQQAREILARNGFGLPAP
ncbi:MAG: molybdate ABC transporter substrate-binding protein [Sulfuritalea sp.]|nr:molybdate ABC transporter substrate-binding protein [Sulfuritalea sp.]